MKDELARLRSAFIVLSNRIDPHASGHELDVLASNVHVRTIEALERLHGMAQEAEAKIARIDALIGRVEELEAKLKGVLDHPVMQIPAVAVREHVTGTVDSSTASPGAA